MGLNGIGVVSFFSLKNIGEVVSVDSLVISNNRIEKCLAQFSDYLTDFLEAPVIKEMGFGGISLADCENVVIRENTIKDNGSSHLEPVCGIFMLHGEKVDISDNRILNNGPRKPRPPETSFRAGGGASLSRSPSKNWSGNTSKKKNSSITMASRR